METHRRDSGWRGVADGTLPGAGHVASCGIRRDRPAVWRTWPLVCMALLIAASAAGQDAIARFPVTTRSASGEEVLAGGHFLAADQMSLITTSLDDPSLNAWELPTGRHLARLALPMDPGVYPGVARLSPLGAKIAVLGYDMEGGTPTLLLVDLEARASIVEIPLPADSEFGDIAWSQGDAHLALLPNVGSELWIWTLSDSEWRAVQVSERAASMAVMEFLPGGDRVAVLLDGEPPVLQIVDTAGVENPLRIELAADPLQGAVWMAVSPDGGRVAVARLAPTEVAVRVHTIPSGEILHELPAGEFATGLSFSPDGSLLMAVGMHGWVAAWRMTDGSRVWEAETARGGTRLGSCRTERLSSWGPLGKSRSSG